MGWYGRRIFTNGVIHTLAPNARPAAAIAVAGDRVAYVGDLDEARRGLPGAEEIDLGGGTALPGFIDAHNHFLATGESLQALDVRFPAVGSTAELMAAVATAARTVPARGWIRAAGFDHAKYPGPAPTRWDLDRVAGEHPVAVQHVSGHYVLVNSLVLRERGIADTAADPRGGAFARDGRGVVTGLCQDTAMELVLPAMVDIGGHGPNFHTRATAEELVAAVDRAGRAFLAAGLTTVCDPQVTARELPAYRAARAAGQLHVRTACMPLSHQLDAAERLGLASGLGDDELWLGAMKFYADGSLIGGSAAFTEPYGAHGELSGTLFWEPAQLTALVTRAHRLGWQVGVHAQGDRAIQMVLDAIEAALASAPRADSRHRIEHAGYPTPAQIDRLARLGVVSVNQPTYLHDFGDQFLARLGPRAHRLMPLRDQLRAGVEVVLSSDSDVASYRPLETIAHAVRRRTREGSPIGADQALTVAQAVRAHTVAAARALCREDRIGSIRAGTLADLVVLDHDLLALAPEAVPEVAVTMTVRGGRVVHPV
ncbi:MAG TPA: amidohydrolase [Verrucomicrobiae bacterium]|nr:amidohydrolase [Verrucomicrobiae bacterium]